MSRAVLAWAVAVSLTTSGCSLLTGFDEEKLTEDTFQRCRDRADNNNDGLTDCDDPGCAPFDICKELTPDSCSDEVDNDKDGLVDCADPGCAALPGVCVEQTPAACSDGKDNDNDGLVDCKDSDCRALDVCQELTGVDCFDGQDNDRDGLADCNDFDCYQQSVCCTIDEPPFAGDDFKFASSCKISPCNANDPTCCKAGYQRCNPFDPAKWVVWGLPRPIQDQGAFVTNEPCGCGESSGIVSVEHVPLKAGTTISFDLNATGELSAVCGGLTTSTTFVDDTDQCSGAPQPDLLLGVCLEVSKDGARRLVAVVDGSSARHAVLGGGGAVSVTIRFQEDSVSIDGGPLGHVTPSPATAIPSALVLVHGTGTGAKLTRLTVSGPRDTGKRCRAPSEWYRHLARGTPVLGEQSEDAVTWATDPSVVYQAEASSYTMVFVGERKNVAREGIYVATSKDGTRWEVSDEPVIPTSADDTSFGQHQASPALLYRNGRFHLWYTRADESGGFVQRAIAHASSVDGKTWKPETGPLGQLYVLEPGKALAWDSFQVYAPTVVEAPDGSLLMWYTGVQAQTEALPAIGAARSTDGSLWARVQQQPVVAPDPGTTDLACEDPTVLYDPVRKTYLMWYTFRAFGQRPSVRHAVSPNGMAWARWPGQAFGPGPVGTFDERGAVCPTVLLETQRLKLWYAGLDGSGVPRVGYAENRGEP